MQFSRQFGHTWSASTKDITVTLETPKPLNHGEFYLKISNQSVQLFKMNYGKFEFCKNLNIVILSANLE